MVDLLKTISLYIVRHMPDDVWKLLLILYHLGKVCRLIQEILSK